MRVRVVRGVSNYISNYISDNTDDFVRSKNWGIYVSINVVPGHRHSGGNKRSRLAARGERHAAQFYRDRGGVILAANVAYAVGELDLIVREGDGTIVFVEVKTRSGRAFGGAEAVDARKLRRMRKAAVHWLRKSNLSAANTRLDVLCLTAVPAVLAGDPPTFEVEHYAGVDHGAC